MWEDHDEESFDPDDERRKFERMPLFAKAEEIQELVRRIVDTLDKDDPHAEVHSSVMLDNAITLSAKIASAEAVSDYILKMEDATLIKIHARSLLTQAASLRYLELIDAAYLKLLQTEMDAFRTLFRKWVAAFEKTTKKNDDGWGLFYKGE
ncbi:MAG: hypothetical protein HC859_01335 [Bacteroidia bacterium]|nr:hypothetical protein [Bacteroidia bacterium]